jgi:hypothetical protein
MQCANHLKELGLAWHVQNTNTSLLAPYSVDAQRKPLLSWRVHLLPALGHDALYRKFHLDEPWDSPHNLTLLTEMPDVYRCPTDQHARGAIYTSYVAVVGPETAWPPDGGLTFDGFVDGRSSTVLLVECPQSNIVWTEPRDLSLADLQLLRAGPRTKGDCKEHWHGRVGEQRVGVLMADGSTRFWQLQTIPVPKLRAAFTAAGQEKVNYSDF